MDSAAVLKCNGYLAGKALRHRQFTLEGILFVNVWASVGWKGVYSVGECTMGMQICY